MTVMHLKKFETVNRQLDTNKTLDGYFTNLTTVCQKQTCHELYENTVGNEFPMKL